MDFYNLRCKEYNLRRVSKHAQIAITVPHLTVFNKNFTITEFPSCKSNFKYCWLMGEAGGRF